MIGLVSNDLAQILRSSPVPDRLLVRGRDVYSLGRYCRQWLQGRIGRFRHEGGHRQDLLFVAGLPKSGTSWVESMLASFEGFQEIMPPSVIFHEIRRGGSHTFELSESLFRWLEGGSYVMKLHAHGSESNASVLRKRGLRHAVVYRDLRDVAVSHYFYVRRTPWHPEHSDYRDLDVEEGLEHFADTLLAPFGRWIESWHEHADEELTIIVRYEDLLDDALGELEKLVRHFGIDAHSRRIREVQEAHSFSRMSGGRERGSSDEDSFVRKGVKGDWRNHFTSALERRFESVAGSALERGGYLS